VPIDLSVGSKPWSHGLGAEEKGASAQKLLQNRLELRKKRSAGILD
jgi:hypothetical protein